MKPLAQFADLGLWQGDRQQSVLCGVGGEDVAETRRDHASDPAVEESVDRALPRGATAEIAISDKDRGTAEHGLVEWKI